MGQKYYLKVDGLRGSSPDSGHIGEFEISKFTYTEGHARAKTTVSMQMELENSFVFFTEKMTKQEKLKDATLTVETRDQLNRISDTYKVKMDGLWVKDLK